MDYSIFSDSELVEKLKRTAKIVPRLYNRGQKAAVKNAFEIGAMLLDLRADRKALPYGVFCQYLQDEFGHLFSVRTAYRYMSVSRVWGNAAEELTASSSAPVALGALTIAAGGIGDDLNVSGASEETMRQLLAYWLHNKPLTLEIATEARKQVEQQIEAGQSGDLALLFRDLPGFESAELWEPPAEEPQVGGTASKNGSAKGSRKPRKGRKDKKASEPAKEAEDVTEGVTASLDDDVVSGAIGQMKVGTSEQEEESENTVAEDVAAIVATHGFEAVAEALINAATDADLATLAAKLMQGAENPEPRELAPTKPKNSTPKGDGTVFDKFWGIVHRKVGKDKARTAFKKATDRLVRARTWKKKDAQAFIIERMELFSQSPQASPDDREAIHPATWLNQGRYEDDSNTWFEKPKSQGQIKSDQTKATTDDWAESRSGGKARLFQPVQGSLALEPEQVSYD